MLTKKKTPKQVWKYLKGNGVTITKWNSSLLQADAWNKNHGAAPNCGRYAYSSPENAIYKVLRAHIKKRNYDKNTDNKKRVMQPRLSDYRKRECYRHTPQGRDELYRRKRRELNKKNRAMV